MLHGKEGWEDEQTGANNTVTESETPTVSARVSSGKWLAPRKGTNLGIPIIYGTRRTGGILFYTEVSTDNNRLFRKYALAEGVQQAWTTYVDNVSYQSSKYYDATNLKHHILQNSYLGGDAGSSHTGGAAWTTAHTCKGIAFDSLEFIYDAEKRADSTKFEEEPFFEGFPEILFEMTGKAITDNSGTSKNSSDPAWVLYDYLTNSRYGAELAAAQIDTSSFASASTICNVVNNSTKRHECNIILDPLASLMSNIKRILSTCNGRLHWIDGKYYIHIDDEFSGTAAFAFEEKHILGGISIIGNSKNERTNQVTAKFVNPNKSWKEDEVSWPDKNLETSIYDSYLSSDKSIPLRKTINLGGVTNFNQARFLAKQACLRSRDALKCSFTTTSEAMNVIVGDVITVTHSTPGWTAKEFRVRSITLNMNGTCSLAAVEHLDSIYAWDYVTEPAAASDTNLPDVTSVSVPSNLSFTESVYESIASGGKKVRVTLSWTDSTDTFIQNHDFQFKKSADSEWIDGGTTVSTSGVMNDFEKGTFDFRVRARNSVGSISDWVTITSQVISGVIPIPPDVQNFDVNILNDNANLTWDLPDNVDVQSGGYLEIRNLQEGSTVWDDAVFLAKANPTSTNILLPLVEGNYVAKWITSDGNSQSVNFVEKGLGTVYWTNTIATFNEHPAWNGTLTGLYVADNDGDKVLKFESTGIIDDFTALMDTWGTFDEQGGVETVGEYIGLTGHDLGAVFQTRVYTNKVFTSGVSDGSNYIDSWSGKIDSRPVWDEVRNLSGITTYISTTEDDPNASPTWTTYKSFLIADIKARGFKIKIKFESESSSDQFKMTELATLIDMPSRVMGASAAATTTITYADSFYAPPNLVVTPTNLGNGEYYTISAETKTGFGINFFDSANSAITRNYNYLAKGY